MQNQQLPDVARVGCKGLDALKSDTDKRFQNEGMEMKDMSREDSGFSSQNSMDNNSTIEGAMGSMDLETDSVPRNDAVSQALRMREELGETANCKTVPEEDDEEKKEASGHGNCTRQEPANIHAATSVPLHSNANAVGEQQTKEPARNQDARLDEARCLAGTSDRIVRGSESGARHSWQENEAPDYGDDDLAKVHLAGVGPGCPKEKEGSSQAIVPPVSEDVGEVATAAQPDDPPPAGRPEIQCPAPASHPSMSLAAAEKLTPSHLPTQVMSPSEPEPSPPDSPDSWEAEHFDVLLLHTEHDTSHVYQFKELADRHGWKVVSPEDFPPNMPKFKAFNSAFQRSTYTVLLLTNDFLTDFWCESRYQTALVQSIENPKKKYCVIPVICQRNFEMPMELSILSAVTSTAANYEKVMKRSISVEKRLHREKAASRLSCPMTPNVDNIRSALGATAKAPQEEAAAMSLDELYRTRRTELDPGQYASKVISPDDRFRQLCTTLDVKHPLQEDWRTMAEKLGFEVRGIHALNKRERSPTAVVLDLFCQQQLAKGVSADSIMEHLGKILKKMGRQDALEILSEKSAL